MLCAFVLKLLLFCYKILLRFISNLLILGQVNAGLQQSGPTLMSLLERHPHAAGTAAKVNHPPNSGLLLSDAGITV